MWGPISMLTMPSSTRAAPTPGKPTTTEPPRPGSALTSPVETAAYNLPRSCRLVRESAIMKLREKKFLLMAAVVVGCAPGTAQSAEREERDGASPPVPSIIPDAADRPQHPADAGAGGWTHLRVRPARPARWPSKRRGWRQVYYHCADGIRGSPRRQPHRLHH